jgi:hypothetical protein
MGRGVEGWGGGDAVGLAFELHCISDVFGEGLGEHFRVWVGRRVGIVWG